MTGQSIDTEALRYLLRHPRIAMWMINRENIKKFRNQVKEGGFRHALHKVRYELGTAANNDAGLHRMDAQELQGIRIPDLNAVQDRHIELPDCRTPLVSIIIPVYNNYNLTFNCIESIIRTDCGIPFEVIVADDCSTDRTEDIEEYIENIRVARTKENCRFLLNCNNAAGYAKGKYILFLNNDTEVTEGWLSTLVDLMESDDTIGLAGSKLLFPNGQLQEAGGILWSDGSAWNYGRGCDPGLPEFNYVKETDYISGAAIMIPRELFMKAGMFDTRFVPAYCEDSDLAFTVRSMGYRVVYQPRSVVYHFEGMSNGKIVESGIKQYQTVNKDKFLDKWKDVLSTEHTPSPVDLFHARDRSRGRTTVLFVEEMVPKFDDNAGARNVYTYIRVLTEMGVNVKLLTVNFYKEPRYTEIYEALGVEVLYGVYYRDNWEKWLKENGNDIDYVMLWRPECARMFLDKIRSNTKAKIFYNVADLHYVRLMKEYEVKKDPALYKEAEKMRQEETSILNKADRCITQSSEEFEVMSEIVGRDRVRIYPYTCYDDPDSGPRSYSDNKDLLFVGSFSHRPNADAIEWFLREIFPTVLQKIPDCRLHIVGSHAPAELLKDTSGTLVLEGHVSEERLRELYGTCSVCIIPLRYGAGVKGKTIEALYSKIPIVSTSIGLEGLKNIENCVSPHDDPASFAEAVIRLYTDRRLAEEESSRYTSFIRDNFSRDSLCNLFRTEFDLKEQ